jgi:hypothetical protein
MSQTYVLPTYQMEKRSGDGSVTFTDRGIELREPGNGSATEESRAYDDVTEMDPRQPGRVRVYVSNTEFDPDGAATLRVVLSDAPDTSSETADHELRCEVAGNGRCIAVCSDDGIKSKNTFTFGTDPNALEYVELSWADDELSATAVDGAGAHSGTVSSDYPTEETLFLSMAACDADDSTARNVGFDVEKVVLGRPDV